MIVAGMVSTEEEKNEMEYIAKAYVVGQRAQELSWLLRRKNENNNKEKNK